jgi:membrane-associated phospholipid phosphatase
MNAIVRYVFASGICFAAFSALGSYVSSGPPGRLDLAARALRGEATQLALFLTALGYWYVIVPLSAIVGIGTIVSRGRIWIAAGIFVSQILSQTAVAACKPLFHRVRPAGFLGPHLPDYSYPSGHAVTSIVYYVSLAAFVATDANLPRGLRYAICATLAACAIGVSWSRLALGAHYLSDVIGGFTFGLGWMFLQLALLRRFSRAFVSVRSSGADEPT